SAGRFSHAILARAGEGSAEEQSHERAASADCGLRNAITPAAARRRPQSGPLLWHGKGGAGIPRRHASHLITAIVSGAAAHVPAKVRFAAKNMRHSMTARAFRLRRHGTRPKAGARAPAR